VQTERVRLVTGAADAGGASSGLAGTVPASSVPAGTVPAASALASALGGDPAVAVFAAPVTPSGRLELLPFLREQAVSITAHRFGNPDAWSEGVI
jgi:RHH-type proline utilization regulon transcriptional repressor/proline dehydrogenase/delta 1-pyrroline-5-carboxylate dehydrogenase